MSEHADSNHSESSSDIEFEMQWVALTIPLGVAMIFSMAGLVCLWLDVLI